MDRTRYKNFNAFHAEALNAEPIGWVADAARHCHDIGLTVIIVTARKVMWGRQLAMWLALNDIPSHRLYMRGDKDNRKDYLVKFDILRAIEREFFVVHAWDDNPAVIALWEANGIPTTIVPGWIE